MKTLKEHTLIYDDECPMCREYTKAFVKTGMLDKNGRVAYTTVVASDIPNVDWTRARNEITLVNKQDHTVMYGVDSMVTVIGHSIPWLKPVLLWRPLYKILRLLYFFISYNRKVMAPGAVFEAENTCTPDMSYAYRWAYIVFAWLVTSSILVPYSVLAAPLVPESTFLREFFICGGQIVFQGIVVAFIRKDRIIHYLGNVMTISLGGALLLTPMLLLARFTQSPALFIGYFGAVVGVMFIEHIRRTAILELPWLVSASWVLYRILILLIIL